jgi:hypothetical protein
VRDTGMGRRRKQKGDGNKRNKINKQSQTRRNK